jgi:hypothetical protein
VQQASQFPPLKCSAPRRNALMYGTVPSLMRSPTLFVIARRQSIAGGVSLHRAAVDAYRCDFWNDERLPLPPGSAGRKPSPGSQPPSMRCALADLIARMSQGPSSCGRPVVDQLTAPGGALRVLW